MSENKIGKYLLYALGEIILIVIGIVIALQLNNWNELRKERAKESLLIDQMIVDARTDSIFFQSRISILNRLDSVLDYVIYINDFPSADTLSTIRANNRLLPVIRFALLSEVMSNHEGSFDKVNNWTVKQHLQGYKKAYHFLEQSFVLLNDELQLRFSPIQQKYYRTLRGLSTAATLDDLRPIYLTEEIASQLYGVRDFSANSMAQADAMLPVNNQLLRELIQYRSTFRN